MTESAAVINSEGLIIFVNRAWKLFSKKNEGNETETNVGVNYLSVCGRVVGNDSGLTSNASLGIREVIAREREMFELEYPCHSPTEKRWFILRASRHLTNDKLTLVMHINITKRKLGEMEVERNNETIQIINKRLNSSIYKIAHDIQGTLNSIMGLINISKEESDIGSIKMYLDLINKSSINLNSFIKETLHYSSSGSTNNYLDFDILLQKELESLEPLLKVNSIEVKPDVGENEKFYTNHIEFRSVITNLLTNAIKYCDPEKSKKIIEVFFRTEENKAILKIKDNGIGIKKENIPRLFELNFQVDKDSSGGVGLGLYMVKQSVDLLKGTISVSSNLKIETEFTVEIPNNKTFA